MYEELSHIHYIHAYNIHTCILHCSNDINLRFVSMNSNRQSAPVNDKITYIESIDAYLFAFELARWWKSEVYSITFPLKVFEGFIAASKETGNHWSRYSLPIPS